MNDFDRDPIVARALRGLDAPEHAPGFWDRLESRLATLDADAEAGAAADGDGLVDGAEARLVVPLQPEPRPGPSHRGRFLAVAAALLVVMAAAALVLSDRDYRVDVGTAGPGSTSNSEVPPDTSSNLSESAAVVLEFLDAVANGDVAGASARIGPSSEAYIAATAGSVEGFLRQASESDGPWIGPIWAATSDRTTATVELRPGDAVVVVSGTFSMMEGVAERRHGAFPVRYMESAGAWVVEPWAFDPATGGRIELLSPTGSGPHDQIKIAAPAEGTAWLSIDSAAPIKATVGADGTATWTLPEPLRGPHTLMVAFINDTNFTALATSYSVDG